MHTLIPAYIKPHLVPFLFKELKSVETVYEGEKIVAAKVTNETALGISIRLLLEKCNKKPTCDIGLTIFLQVQEEPQVPVYLKGMYRYADGRSSYLYLPTAGQNFLNKYLEKSFETSLMYYIHSWHQKEGESGINEGVITFLQKYNLEEHGYKADSVRRTYYRKLKKGYFEANISINPITMELEPR